MKILLNKGSAFKKDDLKSALSEAAISWLKDLTDDEAGRLACLLIPWNLQAFEVINIGLSNLKKAMAGYLTSTSKASATKALSRLLTKDAKLLHPVIFFGEKCEDTSSAFSELGSLGIVLALLGLDLNYEMVEDGAPGDVSLVPARSAEVGPWYRWHFNFKTIRTATAFTVEGTDLISGLAYRFTKKVLKPLIYAVRKQYLGCSDSAVVAMSCGLRGMASAVSSSLIPTDDVPSIYKGYCSDYDAFFFKVKGKKEFLAVTNMSVGAFLLDDDHSKKVIEDDGSLRVWRLNGYRMCEPKTQTGRYHTCIFYAHLIGLGSITRLPHDYDVMKIDTKTVSFMELVAYVVDRLHFGLKLADPYEGWRGGVDWTMSIERRKQGSVTSSLVAAILPTFGFIQLNVKGGAFADECKKYLDQYVDLKSDDSFEMDGKVSWYEFHNTFSCSLRKAEVSKDETVKSLSSLTDPAMGLEFYNLTIKKEA